MDNLPKERLTPENPQHTFVGVDCFGPCTYNKSIHMSSATAVYLPI